MRSVLYKAACGTVFRENWLFIRPNQPEIHEVSVSTFLLSPADIACRLSVDFQRFVGNCFVDYVGA